MTHPGLKKKKKTPGLIFDRKSSKRQPSNPVHRDKRLTSDKSPRGVGRVIYKAFGGGWMGEGKINSGFEIRIPVFLFPTRPSLDFRGAFSGRLIAPLGYLDWKEAHP